MAALPHPTDSARRRLGFLTFDEAAALAERGVILLDAGSTLISTGVRLESDVILWPNTILHCLEGGVVAVGQGAILHPGARALAAGGRIEIGAGAEIGEEGGFTIKAEGSSVISIGRSARLLGGGSLTDANTVGAGAQILGPIRCRNCRLGDGGSHREPDPDLRGGVLKGSGVARGLDVPQGFVVQSFGLFSEAPLRRQTDFHPKEPK